MKPNRVYARVYAIPEGHNPRESDRHEENRLLPVILQEYPDRHLHGKDQNVGWHELIFCHLQFPASGTKKGGQEWKDREKPQGGPATP